MVDIDEDGMDVFQQVLTVVSISICHPSLLVFIVLLSTFYLSIPPSTHFIHLSICPCIPVIHPSSYTFIYLFIYGSIQLQLTTAPTYFHFPSSGRRKSEDKYDISRYDSNCLILILSILITVSIVVVYPIVNNY